MVDDLKEKLGTLKKAMSKNGYNFKGFKLGR